MNEKYKNLHHKIELAIENIENYPDQVQLIREIVGMWIRFGLPESKEFLYLIGIEDQTDLIPLGDVREMWNQESLEEIDSDWSVFFKENRSIFLSKLNALLLILSATG